MRRALLAFALALAFAPDASGQADTAVAARRPRPEARFFGRVVLGFIGEVPIGIATGVIGASIEQRYYSCSCDDPGLAGFIIGGSFGAMLGASLLSSAPSFNGPCVTYGERFKRSAKVVAATMLPAAAVGLLSKDAGLLVIVPFFGSPVVSAVGLSKC
jgi:hypothetical protein